MENADSMVELFLLGKSIHNRGLENHCPSANVVATHSIVNAINQQFRMLTDWIRIIYCKSTDTDQRLYSETDLI